MSAAPVRKNTNERLYAPADQYYGPEHTLARGDGTSRRTFSMVCFLPSSWYDQDNTNQINAFADPLLHRAWTAVQEEPSVLSGKDRVSVEAAMVRAHFSAPFISGTILTEGFQQTL